MNEPPEVWYDFFIEFGFFFELQEELEDDAQISVTLEHNGSDVAKISGKLTKFEHSVLEIFQTQYNSYLQLPPTSRRKVIEGHLYHKPEQLT
ncbi:hypothetical protein D3C75_1099150 [compost metagenome]